MTNEHDVRTSNVELNVRTRKMSQEPAQAATRAMTKDRTTMPGRTVMVAFSRMAHMPQ